MKIATYTHYTEERCLNPEPIKSKYVGKTNNTITHSLVHTAHTVYCARIRIMFTTVYMHIAQEQSNSRFSIHCLAPFAVLCARI